MHKISPMAQPISPQAVKLIVAMLSREVSLFRLAEEEMQKLWGVIDIHSNIFSFEHTNYYENQMGSALKRKFISFSQLIYPGLLASIKHQSNSLEEKIAQTEIGRSLTVKRPVNLDPGYVDPGKLVLATTKNYSHRIYIGQSMYAEATLHYHKGRWEAWPYTYPDYASDEYDQFLNQTRQRLMEQLSSQKRPT